MLIAGVAFKKTFSYAGFAMQPKKYESPKIALLNIELELKAEKDNAEIRVDSVEVSRTFRVYFQIFSSMKLIIGRYRFFKLFLVEIPNHLFRENYQVACLPRVGVPSCGRCRVDNPLQQTGQDSPVWNEGCPLQTTDR